MMQTRRTVVLAASSELYCFSVLEYIIATGESTNSAVAKSANRRNKTRLARMNMTAVANRPISNGIDLRTEFVSPKTATVSLTSSKNRGGEVCNQDL
jgi:hypothetical protein